MPKRREESNVVEDIVKLARVNAPTTEIADMLSKKTGMSYSTKDVRNRIEKYVEEIHGDEKDVQEYLNGIISDGGDVNVKVTMI